MRASVLLCALTFSYRAFAQVPVAPIQPATPNVDTQKKAVVSLVRDGKPVGLGVVLSGDGRILTALSAIAPKEEIDVKYTDGHSVRAKIGHRDGGSDLALLVPQTGRVLEGSRASELATATTQLRYATVVGKGIDFVGAAITGRSQVNESDGTVLQVFPIAPIPKAPTGYVDGTSAPPAVDPPPVLGSPIFDPSGDVMGVTAKVCRTDPSGPCIPTALMVPVPVIRTFLMRTPATAVPPPAWLGLAGEAESSGVVHGVRVLLVAPGGPAQKAGLRPDADPKKSPLVLAVNKSPVDTPERLAQEIANHGVGEVVQLSVLQGDKIRDVAVTLGAPPAAAASTDATKKPSK